MNLGDGMLISFRNIMCATALVCMCVRGDVGEGESSNNTYVFIIKVMLSPLSKILPEKFEATSRARAKEGKRK